MSESETQQRTIFGEPLTELVSLETSGHIIRPYKRMLDQIAAEYRLQFTPEGLTVHVVDPSNVIAIRSEMPAAAFASYEVDGVVNLGADASNLGSALKYARYGKRTDDPVTITANKDHLETEIDRQIVETDARINERAELIDPDAIRNGPDVPDLDLGVSVDVDPQAFIEVIGMLDTSDGQTVKLGSNVSSITFNQDGDLQQRNIELDANPTEASEWTHFSGKWLETMAKALQVGYVDDLTLVWDEEMPMFAEFEREDQYEGHIMLAPRISG